MIGGFVFNYLTKSNKYRFIYFLSLSFLISGNLLYYLSETVKENHSKGAGLIVLIIGRMMFGVGGSRLVTRKFLAINVEIWAQSKYSAIFVAMSALGMTFGPGLSSFLEYIPEGTFIGT